MPAQRRFAPATSKPTWSRRRFDAWDTPGRKVALVDAAGGWSVLSVADFLPDTCKSVTLVAPTGAPCWSVGMYSVLAMRERLKKEQVPVIGGHAPHDHVNGMAHLTDLSIGEPGTTVRALAARTGEMDVS